MQRAGLLALPLLLATLAGCAGSGGPQPDPGMPPPTADNSRNSLDWQGVYTGTLPCADCAGIRTRIELRGDGSYSRSRVYLGRDERPFADAGAFVWDGSGSRITLGAGARDAQQYLVGENVLFHLDRNGQRIGGDLAAAYRLEQTVRDPRIEGRRWRLIELGGRPVEPPAAGEGAYLELDGATSRVVGNASCNRIVGTYDLHAGGRLRFGADIAATLMACPELARERELLDALARVDNYTIGDGVLSLNRARMAPLARFREAGGGDTPRAR